MNSTEAKRIQRERMRAEGYVLKQIWVNPKKWKANKKKALDLLR